MARQTDLPAADAHGGGPMPFAIGGHHLAPRYSRAIRDILMLAIIGGPLVAALLGLLGGGEPATARVQTDGAVLSVTAPETLRSGNWFELEMAVSPRADVADLTLSIDRALWHRLSIDTMVPDAESAESLDGRYRYHFGAVKAGETFRLKTDGQIQPDGLRKLQGAITAGDGERRLASLPVAIRILP